MSKVLFEVSYMGNVYGWFSTIISIGILFGAFRRLRKDSKIGEDRRIVFTTVMIAIAVIDIIIVMIGYVGTVVPYKNGQYIEIEGVVLDYVSNLGGARGPVESFTLNGVKFECSDGVIWGYSPSRKNGGVVRSGRHLRIRYIPDMQRNKIVYIEQLMPEERDTD